MKPKKILAVDDEQEILNLYETFLRFKGYEIKTVASAKECLDHLTKEMPDLMLLDINMPNINGLQLLEMIRTTRNSKELPIVIISARGDEANILKAAKLGCDSFVVKPFKLKELAERIALELFSLKFSVIQEILPSLHAPRSILLKAPGLKDYSALSWDAYPATHQDVELCILIPRGVRPNSLSLLDETKAKDKILAFFKHPTRWKLAWPRDAESSAQALLDQLEIVEGD